MRIWKLWGLSQITQLARHLKAQTQDSPGLGSHGPYSTVISRYMETCEAALGGYATASPTISNALQRCPQWHVLESSRVQFLKVQARERTLTQPAIVTPSNTSCEHEHVCIYMCMHPSMDVHTCRLNDLSCHNSSIPYPTLLWASMQASFSVARTSPKLPTGQRQPLPSQHPPSRHKDSEQLGHVQAPTQGPFLGVGESQDNWQWVASMVA